MTNSLIHSTKFSIQFVLDKIRNCAFKEHSAEWPVENELDSFEATDITDGAGFTSTLLRLELRWKGPPSTGRPFPSSVVMKVPGPRYKEMAEEAAGEWLSEQSEEEQREMMQEAIAYLVKAHKKEIHFYTLFPLYDPGLRVPKFYYGAEYSPEHSDGLLLMEDLTQRGTTVPVLPGFNGQQVWALVDEIARVHATSWKHPEWRDDKVLYEAKINDDFLRLILKNARELAKMDPEQIGPVVDRLLQHFNQESIAKSVYVGSKYGIAPCFVHADIWASNVFWRRRADGTADSELCALIDWQCVHSGNPCEDLVRMLSVNTTAEYRRANTQHLLEHYARRVAEHMAGGEPPFTMEQLREAYKHSLPYCAMYMCFGVPFYVHMDSVVGREQGQRKANQRELLHRARAMLEDTASAMGV